MHRKSLTCYGRETQKPLTEYNNENDAWSGARYVFERYRQSMQPYQCETCQHWHLTPAAAAAAAAARPPNINKSINTQSTSRDSTTCRGSVSGKILKEYDSEQDAQSSAVYLFERYGNTNGEATMMVPYKCQLCHYWHLSPSERQTQHSTYQCGCVDSENGQPKVGYQTKRDAELRAKILRNETGRTLYVYKCPEQQMTTGYDDETSCSCWHLTKKEPVTRENEYSISSSSNRKSTQCRNRQGDYRMEYGCEEDAVRGAQCVFERYGQSIILTPFHCPTCHSWHIG